MRQISNSRLTTIVTEEPGNLFSKAFQHIKESFTIRQEAKDKLKNLIHKGEVRIKEYTHKLYEKLVFWFSSKDQKLNLKRNANDQLLTGLNHSEIL